MALAAQDVHAVRFRTTRLTGGYRMSEVDDFLDLVAQTVSELTERLTQAEDALAIWRAQAEQLQIRLDAREKDALAKGLAGTSHDTVPIAPADQVNALRTQLRALLVEQLRMVDEMPASPASQAEVHG